MAFSLFAEAFLDGFTFPGVFSRARRAGAPTQVFADDPTQMLVEPGEVAPAEVTRSKPSQYGRYAKKRRDVMDHVDRVRQVDRMGGAVEQGVERSPDVLRDTEGRRYDVAKPAYERDEPSERKSER
jgi:hypothetical protein